MKVSIDIECTPEEARRAMGLPDLTPLHEHYIAKMMAAMEGGVGPDMLEALIRNWAPMSETGAGFWRQMFEQGTRRPGG